jgi:hypothetical protein
MPYKEGQPTFIGFLSIPVVTKVAKTRLFGGPYVHFGGFLMVCSYLYENGAILGRAKRDKLTELAKMFSIPGTEVENINSLQEQAKTRLKKFGGEPSSFYIFFISGELEKLGLSLSSDLKVLKKAFKEKWSLKTTEPFIKIFGLEGIGFGSSFPELTEKMYRNSYENIDMDVWTKHRAHGLAIPEKPTIISLEEQEKTVLQMVAAYASEYYPELLDPLDLRGYIDTIGNP